MRRLAPALAIAAFTLATASVAADWSPQAFASQDTLEFRTVEDGTEHWSTVWLVVIDGQVYIRLGSRAAGRVERNATAYTLQVRIAGQTYTVKGEPAPNMAEPVNAAMAEKYWSDVFVRFFSHPLTLRLVPEAS